MKDYTIVTSEDHVVLIFHVNEFLKKGYVLAGGVAIANGSEGKRLFAQAVYISEEVGL